MITSSTHLTLASDRRFSTLILLTRHYSGLSPVPGRTYLEPSEPCPVDKIDFTDPDKLRETWSCGEADGRSYLETLNQT